MTSRLDWKHAGPKREESIETPPVSIGNDDYALVYDEKRKLLVYLHAPDYNELAAWTFDGRAWTKGPKASFGLGDESNQWFSYYDPTREAVLVWGVDHDSKLGRHRPVAVVVSESKVEEFETTGDPPHIEPDTEEHFFLSSNIPYAANYDRARDVGVFLTRNGIWELDANGTWKMAGNGKIPQRWHQDAGGVWDPIGKRCLFWMQDRDAHYDFAFVAWNGETLTAVPRSGLPKSLHASEGSVNDPCVDFVSHPEHGVVAWTGAPDGMFAFDGTRWKSLPATEDAPPQVSESHLAYDAGRAVWMQGPADHHGRAGGFQSVFHVLRGKRWERQGVLRVPSPLERISSPMHAVVDGRWHVIQHDLQTFVWDETEGWQTLVDEEAAEKQRPKHEYARAVTPTPAGVVAVTGHGSVLTFDGRRWVLDAKRSPLFKDRHAFTLTFDVAANRLVAWGGEVKNRRSNETFFFDGKKWTQPKFASPQPKDGRRQGDYVDFVSVYDPVLGRVVRFGATEVATLEGDVWKAVAPKAYAQLAGPRSWDHVTAQDPESGEILLVNLTGNRVLRFDLGGCAEVATIGPPIVTAEQGLKINPHANWPWSKYHDVLTFVPGTRTLETQNREDAADRWRLDLALAFEAAKRLGTRKLPGSRARKAEEPVSARLYLFENGRVAFWFCAQVGTSLTEESGLLGGRCSAKKKSFPAAAAAREAAERELAEKRKAGWVEAEKLPAEALLRIGTVGSARLSVRGRTKSLPRHAVSRAGGLPSGVSAKEWPKRGGKPMGFLFQLLTGSHLRKHVGIAVFCATDGSATEEPGENVVLLLTAADLRRAPEKEAPDGVEVLPIRLIEVAEERPEMDEPRVLALAERDPAMGAAFEKLQTKAKVQEPAASKLGGAPSWVQSDDTPRRMRFVAQLDFDEQDIDSWEDAGLNGALFVFVSEDEKKATAFWQYT